MRTFSESRAHLFIHLWPIHTEKNIYCCVTWLMRQLLSSRRQATTAIFKWTARMQTNVYIKNWNRAEKFQNMNSISFDVEHFSSKRLRLCRFFRSLCSFICSYVRFDSCAMKFSTKSSHHNLFEQTISIRNNGFSTFNWLVCYFSKWKIEQSLWTDWIWWYIWRGIGMVQH